MTRFAPALLVLLASVLPAGCGEDGEDAPADGSSAVVPVASAPASQPPDGDPGPALESALADVQKAAPRLESFYRSRTYPTELADVVASLSDVQLELADGNSLGAYRYDPDAKEFVLCVEHTSGAFATYDTAPMATGEQGASGGCPAL
jgi:hypothetical protein